MTTGIDVDRAEYRRWLRMILLVGAAVRIGLLAYTFRNPAPFDYPDSHRYVRVARNIAAGLGPIESESVRAGTDPVYPALLAVGIRLGCTTDTAIMAFGRVLNCAFGLAGVLLVSAIGRRLFSHRVALLAAAWCAIDPILLFFNALVLTELPYIAMLLASVLLVVQFDETRRFAPVVLAGALLGLATLTRSSGLFLPMFVAIWIVAAGWRRLRAKSIGAAAVLLASTLIVMSPVMYRNYRLFGALVPVRTGSGASLLEALGPWADGSPGMDRIVYPETPDGADEVRRDSVYRRAALAWAATHKTDAMRLALTKLRRTWSITINATAFQTGFYAIICWLTVAPIFLLGLVGVWRARGQLAVSALLLMPAAYFTLIHMIFVGSVRYRLPAMPLVFVLAAVGLCTMLRWSACHGETDS